jgi:hypothetical protein
MVCPPIQFQIFEDVNVVFRRAIQIAQEQGITLQGDTKKGTFVGRGVLGTYTVSGNIITVNITSKPIYLTCRMIENELSKFF